MTEQPGSERLPSLAQCPSSTWAARCVEQRSTGLSWGRHFPRIRAKQVGRWHIATTHHWAARLAVTQDRLRGKGMSPAPRGGRQYPPSTKGALWISNEGCAASTTCNGHLHTRHPSSAEKWGFHGYQEPELPGRQGTNASPGAGGGGGNPRPGRADKQEDLGRIPEEKPLTAHPEGRVQGCTAPSSSRGWLGRGCRTLPGPPPFPSTFALAQPPLASDGKRPPLKAPTAPKPRAADSCCITARETVAAFPY